MCILAADYHAVLGTAEQLVKELSDDERRQFFSAAARHVYRLPAGPDIAKGVDSD